MRRAPVLPFAIAVAAAACGGSRPTTPTASPTPEPGIPAGSVVTVVAGETGEPVAGATVIAHGTSYTTDAGGRATLAQRAPLGALLDVVDPAHMDRQTTLRSPSQLTFPLWPRRSRTGLDEEFTSRLVYTETSADAAPGALALLRLREGTTRVSLVPSDELRGNPDAMEWQVRAAEAITAATGGRVAYEVVAQRPSSGIVVDVRNDPADEDCGNARGFCRWQVRSSEIVGATIVYCTADAQFSGTVVHEVGHTFGLQHGAERKELMYGGGFSRGRAVEFSEREALAMRLMLQRRAGNRFPDNDRSATAALVSGERTVVCR